MRHAVDLVRISSVARRRETGRVIKLRHSGMTILNCARLGLEGTLYSFTLAFPWVTDLPRTTFSAAIAFVFCAAPHDTGHATPRCVLLNDIASMN